MLSTGGGTDGIRYNTFEGNRNACNVWWNRSKRKANLNWVENYGNSNDWFAFLRYCLLSPAPAGVSFSTFLSQPPSILPVSLRGSEMAMYFLS